MKECTIAMYHFVRTDDSGIKAITVKNFASQIDYILDNYTVISLEDYIDFLNNDKDIPEKSCVLTFDDGLKDHYLNVFPVLKEKKIPACFFPLTQPLTEYIVPLVHQVHFLLAKLGSKVFSNEFNQALSPELKEFLVDGKVLKQKKCKWDNDDILAGNLKYNISLMPFEPKIKIINQIFGKHFEDSKRFCQDLYMSFEEMKEMLEQGMSFGGHTHSHLKLGELDREEQIKEVSKEILEKELETKIRFFSYPFGSYSEETIKILDQQGYECGLTTDFDINKDEVNPFALKRLDTNHLPIAQGLKPITKL